MAKNQPLRKSRGRVPPFRNLPTSGCFKFFASCGGCVSATKPKPTYLPVLKIKRIAVGAPSANCEKKCDGAKKRRTERLCWGRVARETMTFTIPKAPPVGGGDDQCRRLPSRPAGRRRRRACASLFSGRGGEGDQGRAGDGAQRPRPRWPGLGLAKRSRASTSRRFNRWWFWPSRDRHGEGRRLSCCPGGCVTALWAENLAAVLRVVVFKAEYSGVLRRTIGAPCCVVWRWSLRA